MIFDVDNLQDKKIEVCNFLRRGCMIFLLRGCMIFVARLHVTTVITVTTVTTITTVE